MAQTPYQQLEQEFRRLHAFRGAASLLRWDAAVMMPRGSADVRGEQLATLESECHALLTAPKVSRLIERALAAESQLEDWQLANLREMRRERDHAIATPLSLVTRMARATAMAEVRWREAKQESNFALFAPHLEEVVALTRDKADVLSKALGLSPYDSLIDVFSPGFQSAEIDALFRTVSRRLPNLIREAIELQSTRTQLPVSGKVSTAKQRSLAIEVMRAMGFPFDRGRLDEADHPFTEGVPGDVRVTTRFDLRDPFSGLMGVLHETGQAMYDLGLPEAWRDQPVGRERGMALDESQSLLLEMFVGRSRPFLTYLRPLLEKHFGATGPEWEVENLYQTLIRVRRGTIRVDADELTYPVHIMLRYELEKRIFDGTLPVRDLPEAWRESMDQKLGIRPANDAEGCLQDVHWAVGSFGYFPSYALGGFIAAQLYETLRNDHPDFDREIEAGRFGGLFEWLRANVHSFGASLSAQQLIKNATGKALTAAPWLRYAEGKYLEAPDAG
ncbi:MAG: carboxypeptidase M32 [Gammaproteobacteria bacterium]|nr:carboxypeptidase M32 [Gammaproteobacteria bacterium]